MTFKKPSQNGVAGVLERSVLSTEKRGENEDKVSWRGSG